MSKEPKPVESTTAYCTTITRAELVAVLNDLGYLDERMPDDAYIEPEDDEAGNLKSLTFSWTLVSDGK